jgi:hypothetical protein
MSPTQRVSSPIATNIGQSFTINPTYDCQARPPRDHPLTPWIASAADGSIPFTSARGDRKTSSPHTASRPA